MRRALGKARVRYGEDEKRVNHQLVLRLVAASLLHQDSEALTFFLQVFPLAINKFYKLVYIRCTNWRIETHAVSEHVCEQDSSMLHIAKFQIIFDDGTERDEIESGSVSVQRVHDVKSVTSTLCVRRSHTQCAFDTRGKRCKHTNGAGRIRYL